MSKVITKDQYFIPFFANTKNVVVGLNQLGIRNAAEILFTSLLPGLNNVSRRIRYYSFYCWWFERYYEGKSEASASELWKELRKAEYLLAVINAYGGSSDGVPGIAYIQDHGIIDKDIIDLNEANDATPRTFWANPHGVFGQYYVASLYDIAIIGPNAEKRGFYNIIKEDTIVDGKTLSASFQKSVGELGVLFLDSLKRSTVTLDEVSKLKDVFNMRKVPLISGESDLLVDMLIQKDYPTREGESFHRRNTIKYVLEFYDTTALLSERKFSAFMYDKFRSHEYQESTAFGWYLYHLNNEWQYFTSILLKEVLKYIEKGSDYVWNKVEDVASALADKICLTLFGSEDTDISLAEAIDYCGTNGIVDRSAAGGICGLLRLYYENSYSQEQECSATTDFAVTRVKNWFSFAKHASSALSLTARSFIEGYITDWVIYRHYIVSARKQYQTGIDSHKFVMENGYIRYIAQFEETHTSPRVETLLEFMEDLSLIGKNADDRRILLLKRLNADG